MKYSFLRSIFLFKHILKVFRWYNKVEINAFKWLSICIIFLEFPSSFQSLTCKNDFCQHRVLIVIFLRLSCTQAEDIWWIETHWNMLFRKKHQIFHGNFVLFDLKTYEMQINLNPQQSPFQVHNLGNLVSNKHFFTLLDLKKG